MSSIDLRGAVLAADLPVESAEPLVSREQVWTVRYTAPDGTAHEGAVVSRVMTGDEQMKAHRVASDMLSRPWDLMPGAAQLQALALGTIAVQLRDPPEWLLDAAPDDPELSAALFASCREHGARWFRRDPASGEVNQGEPRVRISTSGSPTVARIGG